MFIKSKNEEGTICLAKLIKITCGINFAAEKVGLPTAPPYLSLDKFPITGVSFASGGAGLLKRTDEIFVRTILIVTN